MSVVTLKINGKEVGANESESVLDVARENGVAIPTLCALEGLSTWGGCRLCLVEIEGSNKLQPACMTKVGEGMTIRTNTDRLKKYRKMIVEMLFTERNHVCSVCVSNGHCELQTLAQQLGITHIDLPYLHPKVELDASHDLFRMDHNRCVMCTRCVRVCDEIEGAHTWDVAGRGIDCRVITDMNTPWGESDTCTSCGKCVRVCPTGALTRKGTSTGEMEKDVAFLTYLTSMRERNGHG